MVHPFVVNPHCQPGWNGSYWEDTTSGIYIWRIFNRKLIEEGWSTISGWGTIPCTEQKLGKVAGKTKEHQHMCLFSTWLWINSSGPPKPILLSAIMYSSNLETYYSSKKNNVESTNRRQSYYWNNNWPCHLWLFKNVLWEKYGRILSFGLEYAWS